jgi:tRNA nucleotidyltransferase (CCA-adding enzyme)
VRLDNEVLALELKDFDERVESVLSDAASSPYENLAINGNDILALGTTPGRHIGTILRFLADYVLEEPERNQREYLLELAQKELRKLND